MLAVLAPDVRLHSPITPRYTFEGADEVGELRDRVSEITLYIRRPGG